MCPDVPASGQTSESADRQQTAPADGQLVGLADGTWWTAIRPPVARSDRRLDGGRPLRPPVRVAVGRPGGGRSGGQGGPTAWGGRQGPSSRGHPPEAVHLFETLEAHNY
jgi:hypothetical protein